MEINEDFRQGEVLDFDDRLGHGGKDQRIGRARGDRIPRALEIALHVMEHCVQDIEVHKQRQREEPEDGQRAGPLEQRHEVAFASGHGDEQNQRKNRPGQAAERGQGVGEGGEQGCAAFPLPGQQEGHAAHKRDVVAHQIGKHGVPFLRPPRQQPARAERQRPYGREEPGRRMRRGFQRKGHGPSEPAEGQGQRVPQKGHDPHGGGKADEQGQKEGDEISIRVAEERAREKAR